MKYIGIILILLASVLFGRLYSESLREKSRELSEFIRFLRFMRERVECYLESAEDVAGSFSSAVLEKCGFLDELKRSGRIDMAYRACEGKLSINSEDKEIIREFFSHSGKGYLEREIMLTDGAISALENSLGKYKENSGKRGKSVGAISLAVGLGLAVLLI